MIITHKLRPMELTARGVTQRVDVVQDDKYSRNIEIPLTENGAAWAIPDGVTAVVRYRKPDGTGGNYDTLPDGSAAYSVSGNVLTVALAPQVCTAPDVVSLAVCLIQGNAEINTFTVNIIVQPNPGIDAVSEDYTNMRAYVKSTGWRPNMYLGTDEDGNVVAVEGSGGGAGADGGYYTPEVTQPDTNTMRVSYTPSKSSMAAVPDVDVALPAGATPNIQIGTVETLPAGSDATASIGGTLKNPLLNLGIPQGAGWSGAGSQWEKIAYIETSEEVSSIVLSECLDGSALSEEKDAFVQFVCAYSENNDANKRVELSVNGKAVSYLTDMLYNANYNTRADIIAMPGINSILRPGVAKGFYYDTSNKNISSVMANPQFNRWIFPGFDKIEKIGMSSNGVFGIGSNITIWRKA